MIQRSLSFLILFIVCGCNSGDQPSGSWELASQGFFTGALSENGALAVVGSLNHGASLWRTTDHERMFNWAHKSGEYVELVSADFSPDGTRAVTTDPRTLVLWDTESGRALNFWATPGTALDVAVLNNNRHVLLGLDDHSALLFDAISGAYETTFLHEGVVGAVAIDSKGETAVTGSDDNTAKLWSLNSGELLQTFSHTNPVRTVALSGQSTYTFTAAQNDLVAIWHNESGQKLRVLHENENHGVISARFSKDESLLAVGYVNRRVTLFEVATGRALQTWDSGTRHGMRATGSAILEIAFDESLSALYALAGDSRLLKLRRS